LWATFNMIFGCLFRHLYGQYVFRKRQLQWYSKWEYLFCRYFMFYGATVLSKRCVGTWRLITEKWLCSSFSGGLDPKCSKRCRIYWGVFTTAAYCAQKKALIPCLCNEILRLIVPHLHPFCTQCPIDTSGESVGWAERQGVRLEWERPYCRSSCLLSWFK
jgi:hypothetical protein